MRRVARGRNLVALLDVMIVELIEQCGEIYLSCVFECGPVYELFGIFRDGRYDKSVTQI